MGKCHFKTCEAGTFRRLQIHFLIETKYTSHNRIKSHHNDFPFYSEIKVMLGFLKIQRIYGNEIFIDLTRNITHR